MRQIILDTETTGLEASAGHRIVEIGCVELFNRRPTDRNFHRYLNPDRDSDDAALEVHGLTREFLSDKPGFSAIAAELLDYVRDAEIIIHNAPFDLSFLDAELRRAGLPAFRKHVGGVIDSLVLAKERHPGKRNNLDALCERYGVSNGHRTLHGALLDGQLLAEVYLAMTRGQETLGMEVDTGVEHAPLDDDAAGPLITFVLPASESEREQHALTIASIARDARGPALWESP